MRRREFITLLGGTAAAWPLRSPAQQRKSNPRVGVLWHAANAKQEEEYLGSLTKAFHELGYFEGKNIELDHRFPAEQPERFRTQAQVILAVAHIGHGKDMGRQLPALRRSGCRRRPSTGWWTFSPATRVSVPASRGRRPPIWSSPSRSCPK